MDAIAARNQPQRAMTRAVPNAPIVKLAYSAQEAAAACGVSDDTIRNLIRSSHIAAKKVGTKYLIPADELKAWFESLPDA